MHAHRPPMVLAACNHASSPRLGSSLLGGETMPKHWEGSQRPITIGTEVNSAKSPFEGSSCARSCFWGGADHGRGSGDCRSGDADRFVDYKQCLSCSQIEVINDERRIGAQC